VHDLVEILILLADIVNYADEVIDNFIEGQFSQE